MHLETISTSTTRVRPMKILHRDKPRTSQCGSTTPWLFFTTCFPTATLKRDLITHHFRSTMTTTTIGMRISCLGIGVGNKLYIGLTKSVYFTDLHLLTGWDCEEVIHPRLTLVPIILGSDKTTVSIATGQNNYWPLYISIGNIHNNMRHSHCNGVALLGFLANLKSKSCHLSFYLTAYNTISLLGIWQWHDF